MRDITQTIVPFEEDEKSNNVWFLDHNYVENMLQMFKKVNGIYFNTSSLILSLCTAKELMVGWYHTGPKLRSSDLAINSLFQRYIPYPVLVIVDVQPQASLPTSAYFAFEEIHDDGSTTTKTFLHLPSAIEAEEAEEIGVEHLLRDVTDEFVGGGSLEVRVADRLRSLKNLSSRLGDIQRYLSKVVQGEIPVNVPIIMHLQTILNLLPDLGDSNMVKSFQVKTNDEMMILYISSLVRAVLALHRLIDNKLENRDFDSLNKTTEVKATVEEGEEQQPQQAQQKS